MASVGDKVRHSLSLLQSRLRRRRTVLISVSSTIHPCVAQVNNTSILSFFVNHIASLFTNANCRCFLDGKTYSNECTLQKKSCDSPRKIRVAYKGPCGTVEIKSTEGKNSYDELARCYYSHDWYLGCEFCQRIFRPVCASDGETYSNECEMRAESCRRGISPAPEVVTQGPCSDGDVVIRIDADDDTQCDGLQPCSRIYQPVCGSNGFSNMTFSNLCKLNQETCTTRTNIKVIYPDFSKQSMN